MTWTCISEDAPKWRSRERGSDTNIDKEGYTAERSGLAITHIKLTADGEASTHGKMYEAWESPMERECEIMIQSISRKDKNQSMFSPSGGRIWASCVSCPRVVVLAHLDWLAEKDADELPEQNGFVSTVCGGCERKYGRTFREGQIGGISVQGEVTKASPKYRAIANHCRSSGWDDLSVKSERVLDRRALLQEHASGITVRSVEVICGEEGWAVKTLDYVDMAFL